MGKKHVCQEYHFIDHDVFQLHAETHEEGAPRADGDDMLPNVESGAGSYVHLCVGMMHPMKSPQERVQMKRNVHEIREEVDGDDGESKFDFPVERQATEDAPATVRGQNNERYQCEIGNDGVEGDQPNVPRSVPGLALERIDMREEAFQYVKHQEDYDQEDVFVEFGNDDNSSRWDDQKTRQYKVQIGRSQRLSIV
jgi:hypothetical protein